MLRKILIFIIIVSIQGCKISSRSTGDNSTGISPGNKCQPYDTPSINVEVKDSILDQPINSSYVTIHVKNNEESTFEAKFEREQGTGTYSYFSNINIRSSGFEFDILVTDPDYHSFVTKNIKFNVDTACEAKNNMRYKVYLCSTGSSCL